jgi:outer membrane protein assembly factor BamD
MISLLRLPKAVLLLIVLLTSGCASLFQDEYASWSVEKFYQEAKLALDNGDYMTALDLYSKLEARFPYGQYAEQAQLETIFAHYRAQEPAAAVVAAERFIKLHPRHPQIDYAYYLRGLATFEQGGHFLDALSPQDRAQRDPAAMRESFGYFQELVERFPESIYSEDGRQRMVILRNDLARHELHVAEFYLQRGAWLAAANRARYIVEGYPRTPSVVPALAVMVEAYERLELSDLASAARKVLQENEPNHPLLRRRSAM